VNVDAEQLELVLGALELTVDGRRVRTLASGASGAGPHDLVWDARDESGHRAPAGLYWTRLTAAGVTTKKRFVLLE